MKNIKIIKWILKPPALVILAIIAFVSIILVSVQIHTLNVAHSSFENYYNFRGCVQIIEKTDTYGVCKIPSGQTLKIVLIEGKWYLDGDGPGMW